jgi:hypothetical protein
VRGHAAVENAQIFEEVEPEEVPCWKGWTTKVEGIKDDGTSEGCGTNDEGMQNEIRRYGKGEKEDECYYRSWTEEDCYRCQDKGNGNIAATVKICKVGIGDLL